MTAEDDTLDECVYEYLCTKEALEESKEEEHK